MSAGYIQLKLKHGTFFIFLIHLIGGSIGAKVELKGPSLIMDPSPVTYFSNSVGVTISCLSRGHPPLTTQWLSPNGDPLPQIPGLRESFANGSLYFGPFKLEEYSPTIHNGQYQCLVTNPVGSLLSPIFSVRAIVDHPYEVYIMGMDDGDAIENNAIVLHCSVSPILYKEFIQITGWKSVDQFGYESEIQSDGTRYQITSTGSLIIFSAKFQQLFVCIAKNTLNKKTQSSSPFLVKARAVAGGLPPKSVGHWEQTTRTEIGSPVDLLCPAVGNPPPNFRWKKTSMGLSSPMESGGGIEMRGPLLSFASVDASHNGSYKCEVSNSFGSFSLDLTIHVTPHPLITMEPKRKIIKNGQTIDLNCKIFPASSQVSFKWFKNGKVLVGSNRVTVSHQRLTIFTAVIDDQGVYQCFAQIGNINIQASSEIVFEASGPELIHTFISQSLQPGPRVSLKCSAAGNPIPKISWFFDSQEVIQSSPLDPLQSRLWQKSDRYSVGSYRQSAMEVVSHLNISKVFVEDSGFYRCEAVTSNLLPSASHSARLDVYGPLFIKEMGSLTLEVGTTTFIPCFYGGYPVDRVVWQKNSRELKPKDKDPQSRYIILANGTLRIDKIKSEGDKGQYTCVVSNRKGEIASGSLDVNVMRPPVIAPFKFDENLIEGTRTSLTCNVNSGDLPIEIVWLKDFQEIPAFLNITEMRVKFFSYLSFEELRNEHSGTYTCSASNPASTTNYSASLVVKVPPKWIHEPQNAKIVLRSDHIIPCFAAGFPQPIVKWFKESGVMKSLIKTDGKYEMLEDGSLLIRDLKPADSSSYLCEVTNGVGKGIWKSIQIHVNTPAKVSAPMTSVVVAEGLPALLKCQVHGDPPIQILWKRSGILIEETLPRISLQTSIESNSTFLTAQLKIEKSARSDSGLYTCHGSNEFGREDDTISLEVKARPMPPKDFIVEETGSRFIRLRWSLGPQTPKSVPVTYFILQYKKSSSLSWSGVEEVLNTTVQSPATHVVLEPLEPVTTYEIRIFASNEIGQSLPAEPHTVSTLPEAPSGPPLNISTIPLSPNSVLVRWEPPEAYLQHGPIVGYHVFASIQASGIYYKLQSGSSGENGSNNMNPIIVDEKENYHVEVKSLRPNSQYRITVRAYNSAGMGPDSPFVAVHTPEGAPEAPPRHIECTALSPKSLQIQWESPAPEFANGRLTGYKVIYQPVAEERVGEKPEVKKTSNRETTLHGLQSFTNYSVRTLAITVGGEGVLSDPIHCLTEEDVPDEPEDVKVVVGGIGTAIVSWLPPRSPNGVISKYIVFWKSDNESVKEKTLNPSGDEEQFSFEIKRLKENQRYSFWVTASTSSGPGKSSHAQTLTITSKVPAKVASFSVIRTPLLDQPVILPCRHSGIPPPKFTWIRKNHRMENPHVMRNGSLFITRVKDSDEGDYTCKVENSLGQDEVHHKIIISRPPPEVPIYLGYVSHSSIQVHWEPPLADPPVTGFVLLSQHGTGGEWERKNLSPKLTSWTMEKLLCGNSYTFKIAAVNAVGVGQMSKELTKKTNGAPPEAPKLTEALDGNGTLIRIDLSRWSDGGCPITKFHIEYKPKDSGSWQRIYRKDNQTRVFVFKSEAKKKYDIKVNVENDAGSVTKTFHDVESIPEFFANYEKVMERTDEKSSNGSFLTDPHVIVPIVSAVICTCAIAVCILIILKRRHAESKDEWKFGHSSSQQTWLSSEIENNQNECGGVGGNGNMSIYATLNSTKPIPMAIRDSTVRFQTFGQRENYDAPTMPAYYKKSWRKSNNSSPPEGIDLGVSHISNQKNYGINPQPLPEPPRAFRATSTSYYEHDPNSDSDVEDSEYQSYARPYQLTAYRRNKEAEKSARNTLKKKGARQHRGSREYLE